MEKKVYEISDRVYEERASLVFVKVTDLIYEIKKDRNDDFAGVVYVDSNDVLNSLNSNLKVAIFNGKRNLIHRNF